MARLIGRFIPSSSSEPMQEVYLTGLVRGSIRLVVPNKGPQSLSEAVPNILGIVSKNIYHSGHGTMSDIVKMWSVLIFFDKVQLDSEEGNLFSTAIVNAKRFFGETNTKAFDCIKVSQTVLDQKTFVGRYKTSINDRAKDLCINLEVEYDAALTTATRKEVEEKGFVLTPVSKSSFMEPFFHSRASD